MELVVLRGFHYWSKATVTLCVSVSAATLFSPKTIVISDINTNQCSVYCINRCVLCTNNNSDNSCNINTTDTVT